MRLRNGQSYRDVGKVSEDHSVPEVTFYHTSLPLPSSVKSSQKLSANLCVCLIFETFSGIPSANCLIPVELTGLIGVFIRV